jgi:hypothetical protein
MILKVAAYTWEIDEAFDVVFLELLLWSQT